MRRALAASFVLLFVLGAESTAPARSSSPPDPVAVARGHLQIIGVRSARIDFAVRDVRTSAGAQYVNFVQTIDGVRLSGHDVTVTLDGNATRAMLRTGRAARDHGAVESAVNVDAIAAAAIAASEVSLTPTASAAEAVYVMRDDGTVVRAWEFVVRSGIDSRLVTVSATDGAVLESRSLVAADHPASGMVFDPNPVDSSGGAVPPPVDCDSAPNAAALSAQRQARTLQGVNPAQGQLIGPYVNLTSPAIGGYKPAGQANEPTHVYNYQCNDDRFEEANAYYHIDEMQRYVQSLGFVGGSAIGDFSISVHAHQGTGCNAFYFAAPIAIAFLDGLGACAFPAAVDWAEDPDVIVHEYGHAIQDDGIPGVYVSGPEGASLGEGFADFFAAVRFNDPCLFEWGVALGHPTITCLRNTETGVNFGTAGVGPFTSYPDGVFVESHAGGLVWATALWDIVQALGGDQAARDKTLRLVLQSHFSLTTLPTFVDAAQAVRAADAALYGGADDALLKSIFNDHGICFPGDELPNNDPSIIDLSPPKAFDDITLAAFPDDVGDACDPDDDNDGRPNIEEINGYGCNGAVTNPAVGDTDGDQSLDGPECDLATNPVLSSSEPSPAACGANTDTDGDRVIAFREVCYYNTDPVNSNSDTDAHNDGCEVYSVNGDLPVNVLDLQQLAIEQGPVSPPGTAVKNNFDVTKSGTIDVIDLQQVALAMTVC